MTISDAKKSGRPRVDSVPLTVRIPPAELRVLDEWILRHGEGLSRPEAIRVLIGRTFADRKGLSKMSGKDFEIARLLMVRAARDGEIDQATGFAWAHRIYPMFGASPVAEAFKPDFETSTDDVEIVLKAIDKIAEAKDQEVGFYELADALNVGHGRGEMTRGQLINICRYIFLDRRFSSRVWETLVQVGAGPVESQGIANEFDAKWDIPLQY